MKQNTALVVIDTQFGPMWETHRREETIGVIQGLIAQAEHAEIPILYVQHDEPGSLLEKGSFGWQFVQGITPRPQDPIIAKQATDAFYETTLQDELTQRGIEHLVVVGARTEYCVDTTCRSAITAGYQVTLVADGHTTADGVIPAEAIIRHHNYNLSTVGTRERKIDVRPSNEISFEQ